MTLPSMMRSLKMSFMRAENVLGEFANPKNITFGSNSPRLVTKAAFHSSPVLIRTLLYPQRISSFVKYLAFLSRSISSDTNGSGYRFLMVMSFNRR